MVERNREQGGLKSIFGSCFKVLQETSGRGIFSALLSACSTHHETVRTYFSKGWKYMCTHRCTQTFLVNKYILALVIMYSFKLKILTLAFKTLLTVTLYIPLSYSQGCLFFSLHGKSQMSKQVITLSTNHPSGWDLEAAPGSLPDLALIYPCAPIAISLSRC